MTPWFLEWFVQLARSHRRQLHKSQGWVWWQFGFQVWAGRTEECFSVSVHRAVGMSGALTADLCEELFADHHPEDCSWECWSSEYRVCGEALRPSQKRDMSKSAGCSTCNSPLPIAQVSVHRTHFCPSLRSQDIHLTSAHLSGLG